MLLPNGVNLILTITQYDHMSKNKPKHGQFYWTDLTVDKPTELKEFYKTLFGWQEIGVAMEDGEESYEDYAMAVDTETPGGGICTHRGVNSGIPPQWIPYFFVNDVKESLSTCLQLGGTLLKDSKKKDGSFNYVIVKDPQGTVFGMGNM